MSKRAFEAWRGQPCLKEAWARSSFAATKQPVAKPKPGVFLLDVYCLGVKDAFLTKFPTSKLESMLERIFEREGREPLSPACARKLVEDAVAYARSLGLAPHPDYKQAARVLGGINARECGTVFTFGHEGKPLYIQGPHDSPAFAQRVMTILGDRCGSKDFDYIVEAPTGDESEEAGEEPPER